MPVQVPSAETPEPSRSQLRREALAVFDLAETLAALSPAQLDRLPIPEDLRGEIDRTRVVTRHIARKRQTQYLAKQMRKLDDAELDAIRAALAHERAPSRRATAELHRVEAWRDRLIAEGDTALGELLGQFPQADRQRLRQLIRQARVEAEKGKPLHASRELFRILRELLP